MDIPWPELDQIIIGLLILLRVSATVMMLPVLGHQLVPSSVKIGLIVLLTIVIFPLVADKVAVIPLKPLAFVLVATHEILVAAAIALFAQLIFAGIQFAGQLMSFQMGMTVANVFDPVTRSQQSIISQLAVTLAMLLWISAGAHHIFIVTLIDSFTLFPIQQPFHFPALLTLTDAAATMFVLALKISAPIMLLLTLIYVALGLLSRAVPQIQVFFVSFPLTVGLGLLVFAMGMPSFVYLVSDAFSTLPANVPLFLRHLSGG
ncbi:flagellar biosynthetic protein FliR [Mariprofundus erugo]|uniref:Flagellar biosynthetic protein FliR n=1 Tax=Mariprofundus erugo TaxID=2528639 RepID=A0A5R9GJ77_9PROT|nr:flagellar biosynthetic protein FliR [Mariprofundus erugo]TLS66706.1 flagellar biosynthetic protein FliR [Mariprofundus erugo]TLS78435.1 flagellar biosynthetic protein FliR [Mariprofundus erugo]